MLLPDDVRAALYRAAGALGGVAPDVAWVPESNLHVTLKFLGSIDEARLSAVTGALAAAAARHAAFDVAVRGLGAFPSPLRPRVVWAALTPASALAALATDVDAALGDLGFARETRAFAGHVTLGRVREPRRRPALADALARPAEFGRVRVGSISLMRSELHPRGARYTEVCGITLPSPVE